MILMYHHIAPPEAVPEDPAPLEGWNFTHSPRSFERQLLRLKQRGYRFISLDSLVEEIKTTGREPRKTAVVTFDDGWLDNHTYALPILKALSIPATFFCTTSHIHKNVADPKKMNMAQLRELLDAGMTIGGHTRNHPTLTKLSPEQARTEIAGSKDDLEQALNIEVRFLAYPGGSFNRDVALLARDAGYTAACSVLGPAHNDISSLFWLYRDVLSESMNSWSDIYRLSPAARRLLGFRVKRRLDCNLRMNHSTL